MAIYVWVQNYSYSWILEMYSFLNVVSISLLSCYLSILKCSCDEQLWSYMGRCWLTCVSTFLLHPFTDFEGLNIYAIKIVNETSHDLVPLSEQPFISIIDLSLVYPIVDLRTIIDCLVSTPPVHNLTAAQCRYSLNFATSNNIIFINYYNLLQANFYCCSAI